MIYCTTRLGNDKLSFLSISPSTRTWEPLFVDGALMHLGPFARQVRLLQCDTTPAFLPIGRPWRRGWTLLRIWFPVRLAISSVPVNVNCFLTVIGTILDRLRCTELSVLPGLEEQGVWADLVACDGGVVAVRGDIARLRGRLLARQ